MTDTVIYMDYEKTEALDRAIMDHMGISLRDLMAHVWRRQVFGASWRKHAYNVSSELNRMVRIYRSDIAALGCVAPESANKECLRFIEPGDSVGCTPDEVVFMDSLTVAIVLMTMDTVESCLRDAQAYALRKNAAGLSMSIQFMTSAYVACVGYILLDELFV